MIWTRDIDVDEAFGRLNMARAARAALREKFAVSEGRVRSIVESKSPAAIVRAAMNYLGQLMRGRPLPLQCLLYADGRAIDAAIDAIPADANAVYIDGVRCFLLLRRLRQLRPKLAVVTDLDDLMSRRMRLLLDLGEAPSTGYMKGKMPGVVERLLGSPTLARALLRYESATLRGVEREVVALSDRSVLVSAEDARQLAEQACAATKVVGIAPPAAIVRQPAPLLAGPLRFVFIGSDTLRQNQLTIDRLIALWREHGITTPLVIYGKQLRTIDLPEHVSMPGFARTIDDVYDGRSILLSPSYLAGGIKTKVLEAFRYGAAVVGNDVTFEALDIGDYPMLFKDEADMIALLRDPDADRARIDAAAVRGAAMVRDHHDPAQFTERWASLFTDSVAERLS